MTQFDRRSYGERHHSEPTTAELVADTVDPAPDLEFPPHQPEPYGEIARYEQGPWQTVPILASPTTPASPVSPVPSSASSASSPPSAEPGPGSEAMRSAGLRWGHRVFVISAVVFALLTAFFTWGNVVMGGNPATWAIHVALGVGTAVNAVAAWRTR